MFNQSIFSEKESKENLISSIRESELVFVSDVFADEYIGGAELTTEALIEHTDKKVFRLKCKDLTPELIQAGLLKHWVFFNFSMLNFNLIPVIVANLNYSIVEYDYKYCKYRSTEKHEEAEGTKCDCEETPFGKMVSAFMYGASNLFWMSNAQMEFYFSVFPFLKDKSNTVVTSVFSNETLEKLKSIRTNRNSSNRAMIVNSNSWIKGVDNSIAYCDEKNITYNIVSNLKHEELLEAMGSYEHFVFKPKGKDTCPRIVIEAKLAGMNIHCNDNCQHITEEWWSKSYEDIESYLLKAPERFWSEINNSLDKNETISGYTTTLNCIEMEYPFRECIVSMLGFCDEVVVVDAGSKDGTWEALLELSKEYEAGKIKLHQNVVDMSHKRWAIHSDGPLKAYARALCTGDWCWQMDSDEIVHESDYEKIKPLLRQIPKSMHLLALPIVEYWGRDIKARVDVNPWKWRLSRNLPHITQGIPGKLIRRDEEGSVYAAQGTDSCDYIDANTLEPVPCMNFYTADVHNLRISALQGNEEALEVYENWFNNVVENLPGVHHYSWYNLERKIKAYKNYWSKFWCSMYNVSQEDTSDNNKFFDKPWSEVTDQEIKELAEKLKNRMGGWIFHNKIDFDKVTPHVYIERSQPKIMIDKL